MSDSIWKDPRITAYVLGELSPDEKDRFEKEIEASDELAQAVEDARGVTGMVEDLYASESSRTLDRPRREAIVAAPSAKTATGAVTLSRSTDGSRSWKVVGVVLAIAATLLLMVGIGPLFDQTQETALQEAVLQETASQETALQKMGQDAVPAADALKPGMAGQVQETGPAMAQAMRRGIESNAKEDLQDGLAYSPSATTVIAVSPEEEISSALSAQSPAAQSPAAQSPAAQSPAPQQRSLDPSFETPSATRLSRREEMQRSLESDNFARQPKNSPAPVDAAPASASEKYAGAADEEEAEPENLFADNDLDSVGKPATNFRQNARAQSARKLADQAGGFERAGMDRGGMLGGGGKASERSAAGGAIGLGAAAPQGEVAKDDADLNSSRRRLGRSQFLETSETKKTQQIAAVDRVLEEEFGLEENRSAGFGRGGSLRQNEPLDEREPESLGIETNLALSDTRNKQSIRDGWTELPKRMEELVRPKLQDDKGRGPGQGGDKFEPITDNPFQRVSEHRLSTFSVDVDTASYSKVRDFLLNNGQLPRPDAVRIEEMVNYFDYDYAGPGADDKHPFSAHTVVTSCPWNTSHKLARIALKGKTIEPAERPRCNLVFLLDTSGSMNEPNKLPLVVAGMKMLVNQLDKKDRVAITVYAGSAGLVLDSTKVKKKDKILRALTQLNAGGSTNGGAGIQLAYQTARDNFISDGVNRVILCTDGDFNVGTTGTDSLVQMVEQEAKGGIFLTVLGFGIGNHNDSMLEQVSGRGNGNYAFIDSQREARKVLVQQTNGTLMTIAKDVKLQIEFNPLQVSAYRLIGYENRVLAKEDFNDDQKDAGEIGAGHAVTALYEIVPAGADVDAIAPAVDPSRYVAESTLTEAAKSGEMMTLKLRYKQPDGDTSTLVEFPVKDDDLAFAEADIDVRFAAAVAGFGMQLRRSDYRGSWTLSDVLKSAQGAVGPDEDSLRREFIEMVRRASQLMGE